MGRIAESVTKARVLVYDIETRPMVSFHWAARDQNMSPAQVLDHGGVLCWSARWLDEAKIRFASDHHDGHDSMVGQLWELIDAADVVIGYNQVSFDDRRMNVEYKRCGLSVPSPVRSLDLLKAVRARFGYPINKLESVATDLGIGSKVKHTGWDLWRRCVTDETGRPYLGPVPLGGGDEKAWATMKRYCRHDVRLTTDVYHALADGGWIKNPPHPGLFGGDPDGCPNCGGVELIPAGEYATGSQLYPQLRCADCGAMSRAARAIRGTATGTRAVS